MTPWFRRTGRGLIGITPANRAGWALLAAFVVVLVGARLALDASGRAVHLEYVAIMLAIVAVFGLVAWRTSEPEPGEGP